MKVLLLAIVFGLAIASCGNPNQGGTEQGGENQGTGTEQMSDTATLQPAPTDTAGNR